MPRGNKLKLYRKIYWLNVFSAPNYVLNSKKEKWVSIRKSFRFDKIKLIRKKIKIYNQLAQKLVYGMYVVCKRYMRTLLEIKRLLRIQFGLFNKNTIKKIKYNNSMYLNIFKLFIKPHYKIDTILWFLGFMPTIYASRQFIRTSAISVNGKQVTNTQLQIQQGSILQLNNSYYKVKNLKNKSIKNTFEFIFTNLEIDYYTRTIILLYEENIVKHTKPKMFVLPKQPLLKLRFRKLINYLP